MTLTKAKLSELRRIRDGATPGREWSLRMDNEFQYQDGVPAELIVAKGPDFEEFRRISVVERTPHIAAFDPPTTGELLDALERCREALKSFSGRDGYEKVNALLVEVFGEDET